MDADLLRLAPHLRDEGDNHLIELAVAGGADCVVSQNLRDLKRHALKFPGLHAVTPSALLKIEEHE